jgi:hypothetical protein
VARSRILENFLGAISTLLYDVLPFCLLIGLPFLDCKHPRRRWDFHDNCQHTASLTQRSVYDPRLNGCWRDRDWADVVLSASSTCLLATCLSCDTPARSQDGASSLVDQRCQPCEIIVALRWPQGVPLQGRWKKSEELGTSGSDTRSPPPTTLPRAGNTHSCQTRPCAVMLWLLRHAVAMLQTVCREETSGQSSSKAAAHVTCLLFTSSRLP